MRREAQAAYAAQPEWVRLRDSYADAAGDDEYAGKDLRIAVVRAMLADGQALRPRIFSSPIARARSGMPIAPC